MKLNVDPVRYNNSMHARRFGPDGYGRWKNSLQTRAHFLERCESEEEEIRISKITRSNPTGDLGSC